MAFPMTPYPRNYLRLPSPFPGLVLIVSFQITALPPAKNAADQVQYRSQFRALVPSCSFLASIPLIRFGVVVQKRTTGMSGDLPPVINLPFLVNLVPRHGFGPRFELKSIVAHFSLALEYSLCMRYFHWQHPPLRFFFRPYSRTRETNRSTPPFSP